MLPVRLYQKEDNLNVKLQVGQIEESVATLSSTLEEAQKVHSDLLQVPLLFLFLLLTLIVISFSPLNDIV